MLKRDSGTASTVARERGQNLISELSRKIKQTNRMQFKHNKNSIWQCNRSKQLYKHREEIAHSVITPQKFKHSGLMTGHEQAVPAHCCEKGSL